jgi:hypothetical protein
MRERYLSIDTLEKISRYRYLTVIAAASAGGQRAAPNAATYPD